MISLALLTVAFTVGTGSQTMPPLDLQAVATVTHPEIGEMSGIVQSRTYPGTYWTHNDSGDEARIFAIKANGQTVMPDYLSEKFTVDQHEKVKKPFPGIQIQQATNFDWEDIAIDGSTLYIADVGNNGNARRDLGVYVVSEPNPTAIDRARVQKWIPIRYPDQTAFPPKETWKFDCEAVFTFKGKLYFISKYRLGAGISIPGQAATLYRLDTMHTDKVNVLTKISTKNDMGGWVTAADLSPDGKTLAVLCHLPVPSVWLFSTPAKGDNFLESASRRRIIQNGKQAEAITWMDNSTLMLTNEQRDVFKMSLTDFPR